MVPTAVYDESSGKVVQEGPTVSAHATQEGNMDEFMVFGLAGDRSVHCSHLRRGLVDGSIHSHCMYVCLNLLLSLFP